MPVQEKELHILLLEDSLQDAELIERELHKAGLVFTCTCTTSHEEFLQELRSLPPDLIISDFTHPSFDGLAALEAARTFRSTAPFIFISGTIGEERAIEVLKKGATDYLLKDNLSRLGASVQRALREAAERREREQAEERLRRSEELFRLITENVVDLIAVLDVKGRRLYNSPSYRDILGGTEELRGTDSFDEIHPGDRQRMREVFEKTVRTGVGHRAEFRFIDKDGGIRYVESHGSVIRDATGKITRVVVVSRDLTQRKQAEQERQQLQEQLRQAQKMEDIGTLAAGVAHDFNNILAIILGYASMVERQLVSPDKISSTLAAIRTSAERGGVLVQQLMTFARKTDTRFEPVQANKIVEDLLLMLRPTLPKTVTYQVDLDPSLPLLVGDAAQIHQALLNLCINARDAMPRGGTLCIATSTVPGDALQHMAEAPADRYACLVVEDTGVGMDEATQGRIFEPFFTTKEQGKGTGLGLAVVFGIVRGHEGYIDVASEPGKGTRFRMFFPLSHEPTGPMTEGSEEEPMSVRGTETVLLVEDEPMLLSLNQSLLAANGYQVLTAITGREAVEAYRAYQDEISLVVSDIGLPELGGWEAFLDMRALNPAVKAVFVTGYADQAARTDYLQMGVHAVVQKPVAPKQLLRVIRKAIDA